MKFRSKNFVPEIFPRGFFPPIDKTRRIRLNKESFKYLKRSDRFIKQRSASKNFLYDKRDKRPQFERPANKIIRFKQPILCHRITPKIVPRKGRVNFLFFQIRFVQHRCFAISYGCKIIFAPGPGIRQAW